MSVEKYKKIQKIWQKHYYVFVAILFTLQPKKICALVHLLVGCRPQMYNLLWEKRCFIKVACEIVYTTAMCEFSMLELWNS